MGEQTQAGAKVHIRCCPSIRQGQKTSRIQTIRHLLLGAVSLEGQSRRGAGVLADQANGLKVRTLWLLSAGLAPPREERACQTLTHLSVLPRRMMQFVLDYQPHCLSPCSIVLPHWVYQTHRSWCQNGTGMSQSLSVPWQRPQVVPWCFGFLRQPTAWWPSSPQ